MIVLAGTALTVIGFAAESAAISASGVVILAVSVAVYEIKLEMRKGR